MNPTNMLELQKLVLENVYGNKKIFEKELRKSFKWLKNEDLVNLYIWAIGKFNGQYCKIVDCVYSSFDFQNSISISNYVSATIYS